MRKKEGIYRLGLCYENFPTSYNKITPLMVPLEVSLIFLNGLLDNAIEAKGSEAIVDSIKNAIETLREEWNNSNPNITEEE